MIENPQRDRNGHTCWNCKKYQYDTVSRECRCNVSDCYDFAEHRLKEYQEEDTAITKEKILCMVITATHGQLRSKTLNLLKSQIESTQKLDAARNIAFDIIDKACKDAKDLFIQYWN